MGPDIKKKTIIIVHFLRLTLQYMRSDEERWLSVRKFYWELPRTPVNFLCFTLQWYKLGVLDFPIICIAFTCVCIQLSKLTWILTLLTKYVRDDDWLHWENYISISFHSEWDMIVVTVFEPNKNNIWFKNCHRDHIPFTVKGNGNIVFSVYLHSIYPLGLCTKNRVYRKEPIFNN